MKGAILQFGDKYEDYISDVVCDLLTYKGKTIKEILDHGCWECNNWANCPVAFAFGVKNINEAPAIIKPRAEEFIMLFDNGLIPKPKV